MTVAMDTSHLSRTPRFWSDPSAQPCRYIARTARFASQPAGKRVGGARCDAPCVCYGAVLQPGWKEAALSIALCLQSCAAWRVAVAQYLHHWDIFVGCVWCKDALLISDVPPWKSLLTASVCSRCWSCGNENSCSWFAASIVNPILSESLRAELSVE